MKVNIDGYEIELKAKFYGDKATKEQALYFLNFLSMVFNDASKYNELANKVNPKSWYEHDANKYKEIADNLYDIVSINGGYKK